VLLRQAGVSAAEVLELQRAVRSLYNIRHLRVGQAYSIEVTADGLLQHFMYEIDAQRRLEVVRRGQTFVGQLEPIVYEHKERVVQGTIHGSLYAVLASQKETPKIAVDLVDIFSWEVDFHTDVRDGNTFRVLIEERYRDGELVGYHRILAAELVNRKHISKAVYYPPDGDNGAYYHPDGRSMRRMFLRSPLRYTRISSRFSHRRFHPVLKGYRPHLGIDYAAPVGTPVRSVADGVVIRAGRKKAEGKMVKIRHNRIYTTYYMHLSRFARGLRVGKRVTQGQVIGYVGSTGRATGPHLDFRMTKHGKYLNPLRHKNIEAPSLSRQALPAFQAYAERLLAKLAHAEPGRQQWVTHTP
jgi:murein DD-endopeptidase MepM/ murein hydrolase activator NlpD